MTPTPTDEQNSELTEGQLRRAYYVGYDSGVEDGTNRAFHLLLRGLFVGLIFAWYVLGRHESD